MNKQVIITIGVVLAIAVGAVVIWLVAASTRPIQQTNNNPTTTPTQQSSPSDNIPLNTTDNTGQGSESAASVTIENMAFSPATITVKKGTTVTWTNQDNVGHNVVSNSDAPAGGPPQTADLFGKGEVFSFKYDTVGTFPYHCSAHPFMQGKVVVTQ